MDLDISWWLNNMKKIRTKSLTMQIWLSFMAMVLVLIIIFSIVNFFMIKDKDKSKDFSDLKTYQEVILKSGYSIENEELAEYLSKYQVFKGTNYFFVSTGLGKSIILGDRFPNMNGPRESQTVIKWIASYTSKVSQGEMRFSETYNNRQYFFLIRKINLSLSQGDIYLVTYKCNPEHRDGFLQINTISIIIIIMLGFITAKIISKNLAKPLKMLELHTEKIARKEWSEPLVVEREDEIGRLVMSVNKMQAALKAADEEEQSFLQSISHDLKTPVMVIKSYAEAILDGIYIENLDETAKLISGEATKLEHKIKQLIYFNSLNYVMDNEKVSDELSLDLLCGELYERFKHIRNDLRWDLSLDEVILKNANKDKLTVALENILDNQLRYAKSKISIKLSNDGNGAVLEIYNDGPQISENDLNRIFDKFYKAKKGNFGLGLAITQKIIEFHNGTIDVINRDKGVSFIIKIK